MNNTNEIEELKKRIETLEIKELKKRVEILENALYMVLDCINFDCDEKKEIYKLVTDASGIDFIECCRVEMKKSTAYHKE